MVKFQRETPAQRQLPGARHQKLEASDAFVL
jgi:hypothetical protein